jgi:hypothetical protein
MIMKVKKKKSEAGAQGGCRASEKENVSETHGNACIIRNKLLFKN